MNKTIWDEYDWAAKHVATRWIRTGVLSKDLPDLLSARCCREINKDPDAFMDRVNETAYAIRMEQSVTH